MSEAREIRRLRKQMLLLEGARHRQEAHANAQAALGRMHRVTRGFAQASLVRQALPYVPVVVGVVRAVRWGPLIKWGAIAYAGWFAARVVLDVRRSRREHGAEGGKRRSRERLPAPRVADDGVSDLVD